MAEALVHFSSKAARIHHEVINDQGLMDKNFGIGFFICDRLFGTLCSVEPAFNYVGYKVARERFRSIVQ